MMTKDNKNKRKFFQFSKFIVVIAIAIFVWCLYQSFHINFMSVMDTTIFGIAITTSGTITVTSIVWYLKKAQTENTYKEKSNFIEVVNDTQIKYNREILQMKKDFGVNDYDITEIENKSVLDDYTNEAISDTKNTLDNAISESTSSIEIQRV